MRAIIVCTLLSGSAALPNLWAQSDRLAGSINPANTVILKSTFNPKARPEFDRGLDRGPVNPALRLDGIIFHFKPTASQQSALEELLQQQQNPASPNYRQWLQPDEFADRFGLSPNDLAKVVAWAQSQGLRVEYQGRMRTSIRFSGSAAQVQSAFHLELHRYQVDGEMHFANAVDPSIPAALEPLLLAIRGLNDFYPKPPHRISRQLPDFTSATGTHFLFPADLWTIYDMNPLLTAGLNGSGQKLVVAGQSNIDLTDVRSFRKQTGLAANDPQIVIGGSNPGTVSSQTGEIDLDLEWASGMAPNATIYYVYANNSFDAIQYAIDNNLAPVISTSYSECESQVTTASAAALESIAQQGNALGITLVAASGDQGAAACDTGATETTAINGLAVNLPASIPEVTAVGGTTFSDANSGYWSAANNAVNGGSALKYIPEVAWNDSSVEGHLSSSGGGVSTIYRKPSWQAGFGVPNDGARDVPDVAFAASPNHVGFAVVENGAAALVGGTSASAPVFAGMLVLLNNYLAANHLQAKTGLGNVNSTLYRIARSSLNVFHDVTSGSNIVACAINTPNCINGNMGWAAGPGYDLPTGWGSIDLANLASQWTMPAGGALTFTAAPAVMIQNASTSACPFAQYLTLQETNGYGVDLTNFTGNSDYSANILNVFGSLRVPPLGSLSAPVCWNGATAPGSATLTIAGLDTLGDTVYAKTGIGFQSAAQATGSLGASPATLTLSAASASQPAGGIITLTVPPQQQWSVTVNPASPASGWLTISPQSGSGPAQITVIASGAGLSNGVYTANLVFQSQNTSPQFFEVGVIFTIGASSAVKITAIANAASYQQAAAPGMYLSIFGSALAPPGTNVQSSTSPLPPTLAGVSATINGLPAAIEYASPGQVNLLVPFEIPAGSAILGLNNNGQVASYVFPVTVAAPGIFVDGNGFLAGAANAARGSEIAFYITGQGDVSPAIPSNTAVAPPATLPKPLLPVSVTIGGVPAVVAYSGLAAYFEGLTQINVIVPATIGLGSQAVIVTIGGIVSPAAQLNITN